MTTTDTITPEPYVIHRVMTNYLTRWPCAICGGHTEKHSVLWHYVDEYGDVCDRCGESDLSELPQRFRDRAEDLRLHAEKLREQADFWDAQAADPARWRRTHDLLEDPETIAWNLEAGNLRRCRGCEYLGEPLQSDADYFAGVAYIDCPTHGRSEFPSRNDPSPAAAMTPDPFDGHDDPKCPTCGSRLSPFV